MFACSFQGICGKLRYCILSAREVLFYSKLFCFYFVAVFYTQPQLTQISTTMTHPSSPTFLPSQHSLLKQQIIHNAVISPQITQSSVTNQQATQSSMLTHQISQNSLLGQQISQNAIASPRLLAYSYGSVADTGIVVDRVHECVACYLCVWLRLTSGMQLDVLQLV